MKKSKSIKKVDIICLFIQANLIYVRSLLMDFKLFGQIQMQYNRFCRDDSDLDDKFGSKM